MLLLLQPARRSHDRPGQGHKAGQGLQRQVSEDRQQFQEGRDRSETDSRQHSASGGSSTQTVPGIPRPSGTPGTPEIEETSPRDPSSSSLAMSVVPQYSPFTQAAQRPASHDSIDSVRRRPKRTPEMEPRQRQRDVSPRGRRDTSTPDSKAEPEPRGRALSFLLTTMPEITDIGFRGGKRLMRKLARGASLGATPRIQSQAQSGKSSAASEKQEVPDTQPGRRGGKASHSGLRKGDARATLASMIAPPGPGSRQAVGIRETDPPRSSRETRLSNQAAVHSKQEMAESTDWLFATMPPGGMSGMSIHGHVETPSAHVGEPPAADKH